MNAKEALKNIKREAGIPYFSTLYDIDDWRDDFKTIETALDRLEKIENTSPSVLREDISKKLKAIEIIKEKRVDCFILPFQKSVEQYNSYTCNYTSLTETEFSLLKEVLK